MKTKLSLAGVFSFLALITFGQTVPFPTDTVFDTSVPFSEKMDDVFGNLDLTDVTTDSTAPGLWPSLRIAVIESKPRI